MTGTPIMVGPPLTATYRLQLHEDFPLDQARRIVPYLARLGVSHLYLSPITTARPGSTHGYDVADPTRVNPELGGEDAFAALVAEARRLGLGIVLDVVPNHMGIGPSNPMWEDLLARGRASRYARWFDVDWNAPSPKGRVLLPVLGDKRDAVIERDELALVRQGGHVRVKYFDHTFPTDPATVAELPDDLEAWTKGSEGRERLRAFLARQHYELAFWRRASSEINYRRFFDVNELAALRQEDPEVFAETHARILDLVAERAVDGLRIDHVDGLRYPQAYLERLRGAVTERRGDEHVPIFVEKILSPGEKLRAGWPVDGTTGYEFLNDLECLFLERAGAARLEREYRRAAKFPEGMDFADVARRGKRAVLENAFAADVGRLARLLAPALRDEMKRLGISQRALADGIVELVTELPVYRTYADGKSPLHPDDRAVIKKALRRAHARDDAPRAAVELVGKVLLGEIGGDDPRVAAFVLRFQQTSGPATAKGVEDTALYRYVPLASRNEVGGEPDRPLDNPAALVHRANEERAASWPYALVCTNTHDTKRSADVRARIDVLTEMPELWETRVAEWRRLNARWRGRSRRRIVPDGSAEWLLYQTLLGIWPVDGGAGVPDAGALESLRDRVQRYMEKASREAKARTTWTDPDADWEAALKEFVAAILDPARSARFIAEMSDFARAVDGPATWNALSRALVHCMAPGTPDIYQGDELWNRALVDPDNRQPVDYAQRERLLAALDSGPGWARGRPGVGPGTWQKRAGEGTDPGRTRDGVGTDSASSSLEALARELLASPHDGRLKLHVMRTALGLRRERGAGIATGAYEGLAAVGTRANHLFAFARCSGDATIVVAVPRLTVALSCGEAPLGSSVWRDTWLPLPASAGSAGSGEWENRLTGRLHEGGASISAAELFDTLPVALLTRRGTGRNRLAG